jgi:gliding motility-associated-like protein
MQEFRVYDRYGKCVFTTTDRNTGWDGRYTGNDMPMDTYFWTVTAKNNREGTAVYRGNVTLLR